MDWIRFIPLILRIISIAPKVQETLRGGGSITDLFAKLAPDILPIVKDIGASIWPSLPGPAQVEAGALAAFDPKTVSWVQESMNKLGFKDNEGLSLAPDGNYGQRTKDAVTKFQTKHGLDADGWAGRQTNAVIMTELAKL